MNHPVSQHEISTRLITDSIHKSNYSSVKFVSKLLLHVITRIITCEICTKAFTTCYYLKIQNECIQEPNHSSAKFVLKLSHHVIPWRFTNEYMQELNHSSVKFILKFLQHVIMYLKIHKWIHAGAKPFKCKICIKHTGWFIWKKNKNNEL